MRFAAPFVLLLLAGLLVSQSVPVERVGPRPDGSFLLNSGWSLRPAGRQIPLSTFPMSSLVSPDGKYLLVLQAGYMKPSVSVHDIKSFAEVSRVPLADAWLGMTFAPNSSLVYVSGGSSASVFELALTPEGQLEPRRTFEITPLAERDHTHFLGDIAFSPDGRLLYAAELFTDSIRVINPQSGTVIEKWKTGRRPYRILFHPDGKSFFVTAWAGGSLYQHDAASGAIISRTPLGPAPMDIVWRDKKTQTEDGQDAPFKARLFVTASNTNRVFVLGISEEKAVRLIETLNVSMTPQQPAGMTPSALALSPDQDRLYVVCSDANAVAAADVSEARTRLLGFIPTGWYPTAARVLPTGPLVVLNGRGGASYPNPEGPNPTKTAAPAYRGDSVLQYVGAIQKGSMSVVSDLAVETIDRSTRTVLRNSPYNDRKLNDAGIVPGNPVPTRPGDFTPIEHVVYILKENRTYDQVLGDLGIGNGDPSLTLFGERITPNHHKLAREFVLLDNFYVNADVSADGHNWSTAAIAPAYVQRMWPNSYGGRRKRYDYEGSEPAALPPAGYLWSNALQKDLTLRNYGWWATNIKEPQPLGAPQIKEVRDPALAPHTCMEFRNFDLAYKDIDRAQVFLRELAAFEANNNLPRLILLKLPNDHTSGAAAGKVHALSAAADNDAALGMVVAALSRSKFWPKMAVFVIEDDAQNGPDHVDSHRSPAFILSPYTRNRGVDSTMYNTVSLLRTIELILGLRPMTSFDAGARPMANAFGSEPNLAPYTAEKPRVSLEERNPPNTTAALRSAKLDFSDADNIDDNELNAILWTTIRGESPPAPVRSIFSR